MREFRVKGIFWVILYMVLCYAIVAVLVLLNTAKCFIASLLREHGVFLDDSNRPRRCDIAAVSSRLPSRVNFIVIILSHTRQFRETQQQPFQRQSTPLPRRALLGLRQPSKSPHCLLPTRGLRLGMLLMRQSRLLRSSLLRRRRRLLM